MDHLMHVYRRLPIAFERGDGAYLYDTEGNQYLDALCGIAVTGLGHNYPALTRYLQEQAGKLIHTSNLFQIPHQTELADILARLSGLDKAFFCNSGAEAVECAIKMARLYGHKKGIEFPHIVVMEHAFHGRTLATVSAGGNKKIKAGFEPLVTGFIRAPFNDIDALENIAEKHDDVVAVMVEPIQGEGGIFVPDDNYLELVREVCDKNGWLMILDEVQTGMGRTGRLFNYQKSNILPDILTLAKGLANGIPIGACLSKKECDVFEPGNHGSTFGGNPFACGAAVVTLKEIEKHKLWENAERQGRALMKGLKEALKGNPHVLDIRGQGLMMGIELDRPCRGILPLALEKRLLFNITKDTVIRLLPPLIINSDQTNQIINTIPGLIEEFIQKEVVA